MANFGDQSDTLDEGQIEKAVYDKEKIAKRVIALNNLIPEDYDQITLAYITSGNGIGEIGTVMYKKNADIVAVLSLTYDSQNRLTDVERI